MSKRIVIGNDVKNPIFLFTDSEIESIIFHGACDLVGEELSSDTLDVSVFYDDTDETLRGLPYATPISYYDGDFLVARMFIEKIERTARARYSIAATSIIGLLGKEWHYGGMFRNQNLQEVVSNIVLTNGLFSDGYSPAASDSMTEAYNLITYDGNLANMKVFGWLKPNKKRDALYQVLFSLGLSIKRKSNDGKVLICALSNNKVSDVNDDDVYNTGSIERVEKVKSITITEHSFTNLIKPQVVFENSGDAVPVGQYVINFDQAPLSGAPTAEGGLKIIASNCNAAVVTGTGRVNASVYMHTTQELIKRITNDIDGTEIKIQDATLVTSLNSHRMLERLLSFYGTNKQKIKNSIILRDQSCGNKYGFLGPFSERVEAHLQKITVTASETTKADCEFVQGYTPVEAGYDYTHYTLLRGSGTWSKPSSAKKIRVIIIGGGEGGGGGCQGEKGQDHERGIADTKINDKPAKGGLAGKGGRGGKILIVDIETPASSYTYSCGSGGAGGGISPISDQPKAGGLGGKTTFGSYSSEKGNYIEAGYTDIFTGTTYGRKAPDYENGDGDGGYGGFYVYDRNLSKVVYMQAQSRKNPLTGESYAAGAKGADPSGGRGGGGSGATCRAAGKNGRNENGGSLGGSTSRAQDGGLGCGGYGGYGGSGGGCGGTLPSDSSGYVEHVALGGLGSIGWVGGNGGAGCILVYY